MKQYADSLSHSQAFCPQRQLPPWGHPPAETLSQRGTRCPLQSWILKQGKGLTERATEVKGRGQEVGTASALPTAVPQSHLHILPCHKEQTPRRRRMSPGLHVGVAVVSFRPQAAHGLRQQAGLSSQPPGPTSYSRHTGLLSTALSGTSPTADVQSYLAHIYVPWPLACHLSILRDDSTWPQQLSGSPPFLSLPVSHLLVCPMDFPIFKPLHVLPSFVHHPGPYPHSCPSPHSVTASPSSLMGGNKQGASKCHLSHKQVVSKCHLSHTHSCFKATLCFPGLCG